MITSYKEEAYNATPDGCWPPESCVSVLVGGVMKVLYVDGVADMCEYICPCGCNMPCPTFFTNGGRQRTPDRHLWDFSRGPNSPTLSPSVRHTGGCKAHYNITDGRVIMHRDSGK